ncbi:MAG: glycosyltransferase [candidate division Zixibacteria bacterium]|nr:glycosyltransferase [candidate division Zixibacteria bacterium]
MSDKPLKVLVLADSQAFHTERYVTELRNQGCEVILASLEAGQIEHIRLRERGFLSIFHYAFAASEIKKIARSFAPDVLNPHFASGYGFAVALAQTSPKLPILLHLWGSDILIVPEKSVFHRRKTIFALKCADLISADSEYIVNAARQLYDGIDCRIIPWGLEETFFSQHKSTYVLTEPLRIIVPRKHEKVYNNMFILRALATLINEEKVIITFPDFGSLAANFRQIASSMVGDKIRYYSKAPRAEFMSHMASHDIYLSSAVSDSSPASLIEAMGLGLIPVAANIPGVLEWMTPESGYTYEPYISESLQTVIRKIIYDRDDHRQMRQRNLQRVRRLALFEHNVAETIDLMKSLRDRRAG